ncbi:LITAF domain-containing protein-like isoform X2 [Oppia nitens]|uniref:LITAF domain-containing protein-like isoform X2 n=1 Tax=Oppia nitens TaxID=1686743 RepID=UPI0023DC2DF3|nr:LITAF domain-containing protein-like isoform X2 [Oppia nitens]
MDHKGGPMEPPPPYSAQPGGPGGPVPPPPGFMAGQPAATVYPAQPVAAAVIVNVQGFGPYPMQVTCSQCSAQVMTETVASPGLLTWLLSGTLFLVGCWLGCCLIPCCIPECQDIEHRCPNCKTHLGTYRRL